MAQEDQRCSNSSSGRGGSGSGKSSKKQKQKKIRQRGLGVAQLEKIRLEEAKKNDATTTPTLSSPSTSSHSYLSIPFPNFHHNTSSSFVPFPPPSPNNLPCPKSLYGPAPSVPSVDIVHPNSVPLVNHTNSGRFEVGWPPNVSFSNHGSVPKMSNSEYNLEGENSMLEPPGIVFRGNLPYESNTNLSFPNLMQRSQQYYQPSSSLMMNNVSSASSLSSVLNFQSEPPSNQSFYRPMWSGDEKMVGIKRPYPFSLDNSPSPSCHGKFPPFVGVISRSDESTANGGTYNFDQSNRICREGPSCSSSICDQNCTKKSIKENGVHNGDFLTLAPPTSILPNPTCKFKDTSSYLALHDEEFPQFERFPYQVIAGDPIYQPDSSSSIQHPQPLFSFFPPATSQSGKAADSLNNFSSKAADNDLDLNLKL